MNVKMDIKSEIPSSTCFWFVLYRPPHFIPLLPATSCYHTEWRYVKWMATTALKPQVGQIEQKYKKNELFQLKISHTHYL